MEPPALNIRLAHFRRLLMITGMSRKWKLYLDTSVFGGVFDIREGFDLDSRRVIDAIVSWNFKHMVRLDKIKGYNAVNLANGYGMITIVSLREVAFDER